MFGRLETSVDWLVFGFFDLDPALHIAQTIHFFVYDTIKIFLLLVLIVHLMTLINYFFPIEKIRAFLANHKLYGLEYVMSALFGVITPFCSCSAIPLFVGFLKAGIPLGVTFTFLITAPMVNEVAIALLYGLFGFKVMAVYIETGIILGILGGYILGRLNMQDQIASFVWGSSKVNSQISQHPKEQWRLVLKSVSSDAFALIAKIMPYVVLGIVVGAVIHGFVPTAFFESYLGKSNIFAVPLAVIAGVPMYTNSAGVIPVVQSLIAKGIPLGTALAFMMAVIGLSLPEFLILKKVMKLKLLLVYFGLIASLMTVAGYIFNIVL